MRKKITQLVESLGTTTGKKIVEALGVEAVEYIDSMKNLVRSGDEVRQKKVYLAYAITGQKHLNYPYRVSIHLRDLGYDVFVPHLNNAHLTEPYLIYLKDREALTKADLMVVLLDHPSTGVGIEMVSSAGIPIHSYSLLPGTSKYVQGWLFENNHPPVKTCLDEQELFQTLTKDLQ